MGERIREYHGGDARPLADFYARDSRRALLTIGAEFAIIAVSIGLISSVGSVWLTVPLLLLIGTRQYALGECMAHEASHRNLSASLWLNEALGMAVCWPFFVTLGGYRRFHNRLHHRRPLADPENSIYEDYEDWGLPPDGVPLGHRQAVWHLIVKPLVGVIGVRHAWKTIEDFYWDSDLKETAFMLAAWALLIGAALVFGFAGSIFVCWILPWLVVVPVLNYWSEVGDHYRVTGAFTRSNLNRILNACIAHNIGYHALHHRYPLIPWFRLRRVYPMLRGELREQVSDGYWTTFKQILAAAPAGTSAGISRHVPAGQATPAEPG